MKTFLRIAIDPPGPQVRATLSGLQNQYSVDMFGVAISEKMIEQDGRNVKVYIVKPEKVSGKPPILLLRSRRASVL